MKSMNVKIPLDIAARMSDNAELNPSFITGLIVTNFRSLPKLVEKIEEPAFNYTFKIDSDLHKSIKFKAIELDLPMNELIGRLIVEFY